MKHALQMASEGADTRRNFQNIYKHKPYLPDSISLTKEASFNLIDRSNTFRQECGVQRGAGVEVPAQ